MNTMAKQDSNKHEQISESRSIKKTWGELPEDICLSIVARLSWDEICHLSCTYKRPWKGLVSDQSFFQEYSRVRLQKPICVLHGFIPLQSTYIQCQDIKKYKEVEIRLKLKFAVVAGNGQKEPDNLVISHFKDVPVPDDGTLRLMQKSKYPGPLYSMINTRSWSAGSFVLVTFDTYANLVDKEGSLCECKSLGTIDLFQRQSIWTVMNPANGTARQIDYPNHYIHLGSRFDTNNTHEHVHGFFKEGASHFQILASWYDRDQNGDLTYMTSLPSQEDLGMSGDTIVDGLIPVHATFYLYKSRTKSWTKLLGGNICKAANFTDAVIYQEVIHAMLLSWDCYNNASFGVYYVGEISGRKRWMPLLVPLPQNALGTKHLFVFQGMLMVIAPVLPRTKTHQSWILQDRICYCCIWKLEEDSRSWVEVSRMPSQILYDINNSQSCCENLWLCISFCTSGDYLMLRGGAYEHDIPDPVGPECMVVCNLVTYHWQIIHAEVKEPARSKFSHKILALFEPRFDIRV